MEDADIFERIHQLTAKEHELRSRHQPGTELAEDDDARLVRLEETLDQCWDLLRQRRALRNAGQDPEQATPRDIGVVEHYRQ